MFNTMVSIEYKGEEGGVTFKVTETEGKLGLQLGEARLMVLTWNDWARLKSAVEVLEVE